MSKPYWYDLAKRSYQDLLDYTGGSSSREFNKEITLSRAKVTMSDAQLSIAHDFITLTQVEEMNAIIDECLATIIAGGILCHKDTTP